MRWQTILPLFLLLYTSCADNSFRKVASENDIALDETDLCLRSEQIVEAVKAGKISKPNWLTVASFELLSGESKPFDGKAKIQEASRLMLLFNVDSDALKINDRRIIVSARTSQIIADETNSIIPTSKIADLIHQNASAYIQPCNIDDLTNMSSMSKAAQHDKCVTERVIEAKKKCAECELVGNVGKYWVIGKPLFSSTQNPTSIWALNYGWHLEKKIKGQYVSGVKRDGPYSVYQPYARTLSKGHDIDHTDYSQIYRRIDRLNCSLSVVDNNSNIVETIYNYDNCDLAKILVDEKYAHLISEEGALPDFRIPGYKNPNKSCGH